MSVDPSIAPDEIIVIDNLHKHFGHVQAVRGVSLRVKRGEVVIVVGPSGSGKSTVLRCINHLEVPTSGAVYVDGVHLEDKRTNINKVRAEVGMVFQQFNLFPHLTALENVTIAQRLVRKRSRDEAEQIAMEKLTRVGIPEKAKALPRQLSGGQQQRVAIARSLINNPDIILADEPTGALDSRSGLEIMALLQEFNERDSRTVLVITHEDTIARHCLRVVTLKDGTVVSVSDNVGQRLRAVESLAALEVQA